MTQDEWETDKDIQSAGIKRSTDIGSLGLALSKAQGQIEGAKKDSANPFFKSKYADLASVWDACRKALTENELSVVQMPLTQGNRIGVKTTLIHSSGEWIEDTLFMEPKAMDPQSVGSAITYARRYALAAFVGVAPEDDDGESAMNRKKQEPKQEPTKEEKERYQKMTAAILNNGEAIKIIKTAIETGEFSKGAEAWFELDDEDKAALWVAPTKGGPFTTKERDVIRSEDWRVAHYGPSQKTA